MKVMRSKGFTLLEVLIVLVILAVLAGLAVPAYQTAVEKSRKQEALSTLGAVRASQQRYFAARNIYADAFNQLDFDPTIGVTGNVTHFSYALASPTTTTYTSTATRNTVDRPAAVGNYTVVIDQLGGVTGNF